MKKCIISIFVIFVVIGLFACTGEDSQKLSVDTITQDVLVKDVDTTDTGQNTTEESGLCSGGEVLYLQNREIVPNAVVEFNFGKVLSSEKGGESGPAEKTQFDVILKSTGAGIISDENGKFTITILDEDLKKLPQDFEIVFAITPPENFNKTIKSNKTAISFYNYGIKQFNFTLLYADGYFVVEPKDQLYRLTVRRGDPKKGKGDANKAEDRKHIDAFISATTKAAIDEKSEPVSGTEVVISYVPSTKYPTSKKKTLFFSEQEISEDISVQCFDIEVTDEITSITNNEGYFSLKANSESHQYILLTVNIPLDSNYAVLASSLVIDLPQADSDIYDLILTYEKPESENEKGRFIIVGPIAYNPCSSIFNPTCEPKRCKMVGGQTGKCQFLYNSANGEYQCGCFVETCNADCSGNCKMPDGNQGVCHIEEIVSNVNGAEVLNKKCVCGPINVDCNTKCQTDQDCIQYTSGILPICATDLSGNRFCTKSCDSADQCSAPFSVCAKMGYGDRGICICPCTNVDNSQSQCNPIGPYNQHCNDITFGLLTDCIDIDNDSLGECTLCCNEDKDCPDGLYCYDLTTPLNDKCKKACMCNKPEPQSLCKECNSDIDCSNGESCVDEDNNPNTPKVCSVPCGALGVCPTTPVYTYCDFNISKYCQCRHPTPNVDCEYECIDDQDCLLNSNGQFDLCISDMFGIKRCTKSCSGPKECPSPYSLCIQFGEKSYCACPCIHFDTDKVDCTPLGINSQVCINKTNYSLSDCFDVDNDGTGECTKCCNADKDCPENMLCTPATNAKCDKVCTCKEHSVSDVCQVCQDNSNCPVGFVCADDDNNNTTPNVCTRVCPSIYPCPTSPIYTYCDNNISKYCICKDSGTNLCETQCESDSDCPNGFFCADDDTNPATPKICTKLCNDGCPSPMICNNNSNYPAPVCMCPRNYCKGCKTEIDCGNGLICTDSDGDPLTPNICTKSCSSDYECPLGLSCNLITKSCDCNRCSKWSNEKCEPLTCYNNGTIGKCKLYQDRCDCVSEK